MTTDTILHVRTVAAVIAALAAAFAFTVWRASPAQSAAAAPGPVDSFAVVARADNPVDALAAAAVAGQLGAPVYLTPTHALDEHARRGLLDTDPDVVVLAGGPVALSPEVEQQVATLLPGAQLHRFGGAGRTETARLLNELPGELGIARPVLAGATVTGDVGIDGALTVSGTDVTATLATVLDRLETLEGRVDTLEAANDTLTSQVDALRSTLAGVTRTTVDGRDTMRFEAMNLQLVNGTGSTHLDPNGLGNVIIGYNGPYTGRAVEQQGSHYLVVGERNGWTAAGGIVAGYSNRATGLWSSVTGGIFNTASGASASVTGGVFNTAAGEHTSVVGGASGSVTDARDSRIGNQDHPDS